VIDLKYPAVVIALTMMDLAPKRDRNRCCRAFYRIGVPVVVVNPRKNKGITELKKTLVSNSKATSFNR
jgi:ferrous iron transport protein B